VLSFSRGNTICIYNLVAQVWAALSTHRCKLVLHGLAAYFLNGLQRCSSLQSRHKQRWRPL